DDLIGALYDTLLNDPSVCHSDADRAAAKDIAIVATGGYGRGLLAPGSDIDLLFLLPNNHGPIGERMAEAILYKLWDIGFKVGHATRTIKQSLSFAQADTTIRTSLLDARLILGNEPLFNQLTDRFMTEVVNTTAREFIDAKMTERDERHVRSGDARYRVEPNIKDGKGGLRDLHTLHWLSRIVHGQGVGQATIDAGVFTEEEVATYNRCEDFLWAIRCHLHFHTGRAEERITFDLQPALADMLGYRRDGGLRAVERFMKHYFLVAKEVGDLTTILCSAVEIQQLKSAPQSLKQFLPQMSWGKRQATPPNPEFRIEHERINVISTDLFERDPINILRLFENAAATDTFLHPDAIRLLRQSLGLIDTSMRNDPQANALFIRLLTETNDPATVLRRMNDAGVLARFIPSFRRVVGMMQFNMYHHYTVDEHLIRTVQALRNIELGEAVEELPLSSQLIGELEPSARRVLFFTALIHDIGKGRSEDHSIVGARVATNLAPRFGFSASEVERITWLVKYHLLMSNIAQTRDLSDPKTIRDFVAIVQSPARLQQLLLLTVADIRAVGPGVWNGWKGQLLRTLYHESEPLLAGGHTKTPRVSRVRRSQDALASALGQEAWSDDQIREMSGRFYDDYWMKFGTEQQVEHAKLISSANTAGQKLAFDHAVDEFAEITDLTIYAPNHARLLSLFAGSCAVAGANILTAQITTTRDGFALDTFRLQKEFSDITDEARRAKRIEDKINRLLEGKGRLQTLLDTRRPSEHRVEAFFVEPEVTVSNTLSDQFTVIEVSGRDRPGLLYDLTTTLS
ncbi:MAG: [protein-PII] uridylyltransferase, partial [Pseudomonadota bacterium]